MTTIQQSVKNKLRASVASGNDAVLTPAEAQTALNWRGGRKPEGARAMTNQERSARRRAKALTQKENDK